MAILRIVHGARDLLRLAEREPWELIEDGWMGAVEHDSSHDPNGQGPNHRHQGQSPVAHDPETHSSSKGCQPKGFTVAQLAGNAGLHGQKLARQVRIAEAGSCDEDA